MADVKEETAAEVAEREAKEAQDKIDAEDKAEMDSYGDMGDGPLVTPDVPEEKEPAAKEDEAKKPSDVPGPGEPGYVEPSKEEKKEGTEKKLQEQIDNINTANRLIRDENKALKSENEKLKTPAKPRVEVDPEVKEAVKAVIDEENEAAETKTIEDRVEFGRKTAEAAKEKHGADEYNRITDGYFGPALDKDPDLLERFQASENPGEFAYQEGKKLYETAQEGVIKTAENKGREDTINELKEMGVPISLTSVPGASPKINKPPVKRDFDDY